MASNLDEQLTALKLAADAGLYQKHMNSSGFSKQKHLQQPVVSW